MPFCRVAADLVAGDGIPQLLLGLSLRVAAETITELHCCRWAASPAIRDGAQLQWNGQSIAIDARMQRRQDALDGGVLELLARRPVALTAVRTLALAALSKVIVIAANTIQGDLALLRRPACLRLRGDDEAIGLVMFVFAAIALFVFLSRPGQC